VKGKRGRPGLHWGDNSAPPNPIAGFEGIKEGDGGREEWGS